MPHSDRLVLTISFILQVSLAVGLTGWFSLQKGEEVVSQVARELHDDLNLHIERRIYNFRAIPYLVNQIVLKEIKLGDIDLENKLSLEQYLIKLINLLEFTSIDTIQYGNEKGDYIGAGRLKDGSLVIKVTVNGDFYTYSTDESRERKQLLSIRPNYDPRNRPWYQTALENQGAAWSSIYVFFSQLQPGATLSEPIYNIKGKLIGVIRTDILLTDINKFMESLKVGKTGTTLILERTGEVIVSSETKELSVDEQTKRYVIPHLQDIDQELAKKLNFEEIKSEKFLYFEAKGNKRFIQITPIEYSLKSDLLLMTEIPAREFQKIYDQNFKSTIILCLKVLLISSVVAILSNRILVRPGLQLMELKRDRLTGLPNRAVLIERLNRLLKRNQIFAFLLLNCDRFTRINDSLGHSIGDKLLIAVAERLRSCFDASNQVARLEGDEFGILSLNTKNAASAIELAKRIKQELAPAFLINDIQIFLNNSIGIAIGDAEYREPEHLLRDAHTAMLQAKQASGCFYQVFEPSMHQKSLSLLQLESELQSSMERQEERQEFLVYYQPIVSLTTEEIIGLEALVRWKHPVKGLISPAKFIPVAEDTGLILDLGIWILREACQQFSRWKYPITLSVNLSGRQIYQPDLVEKVDQILETTGITGSRLKFELTESVIMENDQLAKEILEELKLRNIQLSLDDFGTGYSSLSYLSQFPIDTLKIDRSFVNMEGLEIAQTIIALAHNLGMDVVAEGVETEQQRLQLKGCY